MSPVLARFPLAGQSWDRQLSGRTDRLAGADGRSVHDPELT